ncbi:MAG: guanylate kinase [Bacilli bacterium]|jgi:guanylate kinase
MIILVGASASGKTEVAKLLFRKYGIKKVITHTTRPMREGERLDVDYHFVTVDEFTRLKEHNAFVETTFYNGNHYGTSRKEIGDDKALIVDPNGLKSFLALHDAHIVTFFMQASETTRLNRMIYRGDRLEDAKKRIENDRIDFQEDRVGATDYLIDTESINIEQVADLVYQKYLRKLQSL